MEKVTPSGKATPRLGKVEGFALKFSLIWSADVEVSGAGYQGIEKGVSISVP